MSNNGAAGVSSERRRSSCSSLSWSVLSTLNGIGNLYCDTILSLPRLSSYVSLVFINVIVVLSLVGSLAMSSVLLGAMKVAYPDNAWLVVKLENCIIWHANKIAQIFWLSWYFRICSKLLRKFCNYPISFHIYWMVSHPHAQWWIYMSSTHVYYLQLKGYVWEIDYNLFICLIIMDNHECHYLCGIIHMVVISIV